MRESPNFGIGLHRIAICLRLVEIQLDRLQMIRRPDEMRHFEGEAVLRRGLQRRRTVVEKLPGEERTACERSGNSDSDQKRGGQDSIAIHRNFPEMKCSAPIQSFAHCALEARPIEGAAE